MDTEKARDIEWRREAKRIRKKVADLKKINASLVEFNTIEHSPERSTENHTQNNVDQQQPTENSDNVNDSSYRRRKTPSKLYKKPKVVTVVMTPKMIAESQETHYSKTKKNSNKKP